MLTTKEREAEDVEAPLSGHSTVFVTPAGAILAKRANGDVIEPGGGSAGFEWGTVYQTAGTHVLTAGIPNRYSNRVDGITLRMPFPAADGDTVTLKEVVGFSDEDEPFGVLIATYEAGEGEDQQNIESPLGLVDLACLVADSGVALQWIYDDANTTWRLMHYFKPSGPA